MFSRLSGGLKSENSKNSWSLASKAKREREREVQSHVCLLSMQASAENVDWNKVVGRNKYFEISFFIPSTTWNNFILLFGIFVHRPLTRLFALSHSLLFGIRNILCFSSYRTDPGNFSDVDIQTFSLNIISEQASLYPEVAWCSWKI